MSTSYKVDPTFWVDSKVVSIPIPNERESSSSGETEATALPAPKEIVIPRVAPIPLATILKSECGVWLIFLLSLLLLGAGLLSYKNFLGSRIEKIRGNIQLLREKNGALQAQLDEVKNLLPESEFFSSTVPIEANESIIIFVSPIQ